MKIAVFGGAFNPVHSGHVELAKYLKEQINADRVLIIPSFLSPHKSSEYLISGEDRMNMCALAFEGLDGFEISDIELKRHSVSYTSDTLTELRKIYENDELFFFCGADMFMTLDSWHLPKVIFSLCTVCTVPRDETDRKTLEEKAKELEKLGAKSLIFDMPLFDISSTEIRQGKNTEKIPEKVREYIAKKGLYNG